jgi:gliding motility-associated-like protein/uncharacterized repeat protein (TIGR01451 family)
VKKIVQHILIVLLLIAAMQNSYAQKKRYVELNSIHALSVPENPDYKFDWTITYDVDGVLQDTSTSNVTQNILWDERTTYHITVYPILDSVSCYGEPVTLDVIVVDYLSLHTFDDVYFTDLNTFVTGNVSENDFDETGADINYNPTPVIQPQNGTVEILIDGTFTYTPNAGFTGVDEFVYEAFNNLDIPMFSNSLVKIVVEAPSPQADLYVEKVGPAKALFGQRITYSIIVRNNGADVAENVILRDTLAFGLFEAEYSTGGTEAQPWNDELELGDMNPGDSVVVLLFADISPFSPNKIYNQALVYSETYDPSNLENDSIWLTEVTQLYVDLPNQIFVPSCDTKILPGGNSNGNNEIASFEWIPGNDLSDSTFATPEFTPSERTIGKSNMYVLRITDIKGNIAIDTTYVIVSEVPVAIISDDTLFENILFKDLGENITIYGDESIGEGLGYFWWTSNGSMVGTQIADSIEIEEIGTYNLQIFDELGCEAFDSVIVLLESHPPIAVNDSVAIQAASDSTINVLTNDSDINNFDLFLDSIVTPPTNSTILGYDSLGNITIRPDSLYWGVDSIEYKVCNNGYPVNCSTAWIIIDALRPPLNADVAIMKTGDEIAFWGDTIEYELTVWSNGPDSAVNTRITDEMAAGFLYPEFSLDDGTSWTPWPGGYNYTDSLLPGEVVVRIKLRAFVSRAAVRNINNVAWIETEILENNYENDTTSWPTKIKEPVIANAGPDIVLGNCQGSVDFNASNSSGENLSYYWSPASYLSDRTSPTPTFTIGTTTTYTLTITDDDGVTDTDEITITVLPPPLADAGDDKYIRLGQNSIIDGSGSSGAELEYLWQTNDGNIVGTATNPRASVDTVGRYSLTVTDETNCSDTDDVDVYQFYYYPFAIPDYYSTKLGAQLSGNVLDNDYDPNGLFNLSIEPGNYLSIHGGTVEVDAEGNFTYTQPGGYIGVDAFDYTVCNDAYPPRCSNGYAQITIKQNSQLANLTITKTAIQPEALRGDRDGVQFLITVKNEGPDVAEDVMLTDSITQYVESARYILDGNGGTWTGDIPLYDIGVNEEKVISIFATASGTSPDRIFNAATVAPETFDKDFNWDLVDIRNVDTASVIIKSDLLAVAELVERYDDNRNDFTVGYCDDVSYLYAGNSKSLLGVDYYQWSPRDLVKYPDSSRTIFTHELSDTTIVFQLLVGVGVGAGEYTSTQNITVHFSPELIADAGPNRKVNEGETLVIDATNSQGADVYYRWIKRGYPELLSNFEDGNVLRPIISEPGDYILLATDKHGCQAKDTVEVRENELIVVNDFIIVLTDDTLVGNLRTNDYDPNGDNTFYSGEVFAGPNNGVLLDVPASPSALKSSSATNAKIGSDGTFIYVPDAGFIGYDYFKYMVCDDNDPELCVQGTVYIKVIDVDEINSPPLANHDYIFVNKNDTIELNLLDNDYDFDGGQITMSGIVEDPQKGRIELDENGIYTYISDTDSTGIDFFVYKICDNGIPSKCDTARVVVSIHKLAETNHRPVAVDDAYFVVEKRISGNIMANDYDTDGHALEVEINPVSGPSHGVFTLEPNGDFTYQPDPGFEGTDQIIYALKETRTYEQYKSYATIYIASIDEKRYTTNVEIEKSGPLTILSGQTINYKLKASVDGPSLSNDVMVVDTLLNTLSNFRYSYDSINWSTWNYLDSIEQMMLYENTTIYIRADIPDRFSGTIINTSYVSHDMNEKDNSDNVFEVETEVYQRVIANAGLSETVGACVVEYQLDASLSVGMSNLTYSWTPAELLDNPTSVRPTFLTEAGESQEFMLVVNSAFNGYTDFDTTYVTITVGDEAFANAGEDIWPEDNEPVLLDGSESTGVGPLQYRWWSEDREGNIIELASSDTVTVKRSGDYYLTITDKYGCEDTDLMHVGYPVDEFIAVDDTIYTYQQEPVDIYVLRNDIIDDDDRYDLSLLIVEPLPTHGEYIINASDSFITYIPEDYYSGPDEFVYLISTLYGYNDLATVHIIVLERKPVVPYGFSPNSDGLNDELIIENIELYEQSNLVIFNRWGNIVYEVDKYDNNDPWTGAANKGIRLGNGILPAGVYFYILDLGDDERILEDERIRTGSIYIATGK